MVAGSQIALSTAEPMIKALTREPDGGLSVVGDTIGMASDFKLINQVYCAIQICVTGYAMSPSLLFVSFGLMGVGRVWHLRKL